MAKQFVSDGGIGLRLSPLTQALAAGKGGTLGATPTTGSADPRGGGAASTPNGAALNAAPNAPSPEDVATAQAAAAQGDQGAIDWLRTLGLVGGVAGGVAGGLLLRNALKNKKTGPNAAGFGANAIAKDAKAGSASRAVGEVLPPLNYLDFQPVPPAPLALPNPTQRIPATAQRMLPTPEDARLAMRGVRGLIP